MNQLKHVVYSLPRHASPSNAISAVPSGYQINAQSVFRSGSDFLSRGLRSRSCAGYGNQNDTQTMSLAKQTVTLTRYRNASTDRVGNSNVPFPNAMSSDDEKLSKAQVSSDSESQVPRLTAVQEPRKYASMIADYSATIEKLNLNSKSKELPTGLLSRLPIESLVSSLRPFEKRPRSKLANRSSAAIAANSSADQSNHALSRNTLKSESSKNLVSAKSAPQKRDYFTKNYDSDQFFNTDEQSRDSKSHGVDGRKQCTSSVDMKSARVPNDFDVICELTEKYDKRANYVEWSHSGVIDHKVKAPSNIVDDFELLNPNSDNNQSQFHIVASKEKIELQQKYSSSNASGRSREKSNHTHSQKNGLPWWAIPESSLIDEKYEKAESITTPEIKVIYSEEMPDFEISGRDDESPSLSNKSKLKRPEKLASISRTKEHIKEKLEKQKRRLKTGNSVDNPTNIDVEEVGEGKGRPMEEKSDDKSAKLRKMTDVRAANKKSSQDNDAGAIAEARRRQQARKSTIDQEYRVKRVTEPLKPLEKRKDGTLIDYGLKVPTRRPKKQQQPGEPNPEKKNNSASHRGADLARKLGTPRKTASSGQRSLLDVFRKSGENRKNNSVEPPTTSNCSGERLVNSPRCEQMLSQAGCRCNCRPCSCALESAIGSAERPEKRLIYAVWLNERRAPSVFS